MNCRGKERKKEKKEKKDERKKRMKEGKAKKKKPSIVNSQGKRALTRAILDSRTPQCTKNEFQIALRSHRSVRRWLSHG